MDTGSDSHLAVFESNEGHSGGSTSAAPSHAWQKVTYPKRHRRQNQTALLESRDQRLSDISHPERSDVFASVEKHAHERRRAIESAATAAAATSEWRPAATAAASDDDKEDSGAEGSDGGGQENGVEVVKKAKQKKPKKPKVTVHEAASKIDAVDLAAYIAEVSVSYESQHDIQLMRFTDYFGRAFSAIPLCHISESVYKISIDWIALKSPESLRDFVLWCLDGILSDLTAQQAFAKGSRKTTQQPPSKSQVAIFAVLAMTLRRKPELLISLLPILRDNPQYQGQEKIPLLVWTISQASQGDLVVGMHVWAHYLLPILSGKSGNPQTRGLALQLIESILAVPKARPILINGAVRKGERVVPPFALDLLMRATFPAPSARLKATEKFEAIYPTLKELALAGSPGSKATKQAAQQMLPYACRAMQENNSLLTGEAANIFIWCLVQNSDCYKQWENIHLENVEASISVLRKLSDEWKEHSSKLVPIDSLRETLKHLREMNENLLSSADDGGNEASFKEADKYCKVLLGRITRTSTLIKTTIFAVILAVALGFIFSPSFEYLDWQKLHAFFTSL